MKAIVLALLAMALAACTTVEPAPQATQAAAAETAAATEVVKSKDEMTQEERVATYNEQQADDKDRVVCRSYMPTGSHRKKTICRTVAEIELERQAAQDVLRDAQKGGVRPSN